jgi:prephenate dehydratase
MLSAFAEASESNATRFRFIQRHQNKKHKHKQKHNEALKRRVTFVRKNNWPAAVVV